MSYPLPCSAQGLGTMRWESGRQQYAGEWDNNTPNGVGLHIWFSEQVVAQTDQGIPSHAQLLMYNRCGVGARCRLRQPCRRRRKEDCAA